jgi:uncharacterized protein involved in exopolysaccharide biosynthesis
MDAITYRRVAPKTVVRPFNLFRTVSDYWVPVVLVLLISMLAGFILILVQTPTYESRATLFIKFGREQVYRPEVGPDAPPIAPATTDTDETVMTQLQLFSSRDLIVKTIDQIGLYRLYPELAPAQHQEGVLDRSELGQQLQRWYSEIVPSTVSWFRNGTPMDQAVRKFQGSLSISRTRSSALIQIAFWHRDPAMAQTVLRSLLLEHRRLSTSINQTAGLAFYELAANAAEARLADAQAQLAEFRDRYGVLAFPGQLATLLTQREQLSAGLHQASIEFAAVQSRAAELQRQRNNVQPEIKAFTDTATGSHFSGVLRSERNPTLTAVENDIQQNDATSKSLTGRIAEIERQKSALDSQISQAGRVDSERLRLEGDVSTLDQARRNLTARREEARALANLEKLQNEAVLLVQAPTVSTLDEPVRPAPLLYMAMSVAVGLGFGITIAVISALFSTRVRRWPVVRVARDLPRVRLDNDIRAGSVRREAGLSDV